MRGYGPPLAIFLDQVITGNVAVGVRDPFAVNYRKAVLVDFQALDLVLEVTRVPLMVPNVFQFLLLGRSISRGIDHLETVIEQAIQQIGVLSAVGLGPQNRLEWILCSWLRQGPPVQL